MAFDQGLAQRLRERFQERGDVAEKKMFGGLCFMVSGHMCCGIVGEVLMARVGLDNYQQCLNHEHAAKMDFTGKALKGFVYVSPEGIESDSDLEEWVNMCLDFIETLPPK